jgi:hypothetical protein
VAKARPVLDNNVLVSAVVLGGRLRVVRDKVILGAVAMASPFFPSATFLQSLEPVSLAGPQALPEKDGRV